jgi:ADP-ribose pyrophosphatase YjhB (NUDIX family)
MSEISKKPQRYKIYINEVEVILIPTADLFQYDLSTAATLVIHCVTPKKHILESIETIEVTQYLKRCIIHSQDFKGLKSAFKSEFTEIEAGGGLVYNEEGEYLFIYRRGSWDLPKGKIEKNETKKNATAREIIEETGIKSLEVQEKLMVTRHTYRSNVGKRLIKKSHWYLVYAPKQKLVPQTTEDIEKAQWMTLPVFFGSKRKVYPNILDVVHTQDTADLINRVKIRIK